MEDMDEFDRIISRLNIRLYTIDYARELYLKVVKTKNLKFRFGPDIKILGSMYVACRHNQENLTLKELCSIVGADYGDRKSISKMANLISREFNITVMGVMPIDLIPKLITALKLSEETRTKSEDMADYLVKVGVTPRGDPNIFAAAIVYLCAAECGELRTQRDMSDACGATETAIRHNVNHIYPDIKHLLKYDRVKWCKKFGRKEE